MKEIHIFQIPTCGVSRELSYVRMLKHCREISAEEVQMLIMSREPFAVWYGYFGVDARHSEEFFIHREDGPAVYVMEEGKKLYCAEWRDDKEMKRWYCD